MSGLHGLRVLGLGRSLATQKTVLAPVHNYSLQSRLFSALLMPIVYQDADTKVGSHAVCWVDSILMQAIVC